MNTTILPSSMQFLKKLKTNNTREWFTENKAIYEAAKSNVKAFVDELFDMLNEHDLIESSKMFRIYRDVRFSKDKTPYKSSFGISYSRATAARRGGCYLHLEPDNFMVAGGFWKPESADLKRIRQELAYDAQPLRDILQHPTLKKHFGKLSGDQVKTAPKGYKKDHENIDLLKHKQFLLIERFTEDEVCSKDFMQKCNESFKAMRPFHDFMSNVLTTNENGESIL